MEVLKLAQKQQLAVEMYNFFGIASEARQSLLDGFQNEKGYTSRTLYRYLKRPETMSAEIANFIIKVLMPAVDEKPLRDMFVELFGNQPEHYGYEIPQEIAA